MTSSSAPARRRRGTIQKLPSGSLRVRVYAGYDSVTKQRHYLTEVVPAGPRAAAQAEKVRTRLAAEVDAGRQPRTAATVGQLMERYLEIVRVEPSTRQGYEGLVRNHIVPLLGEQQVGRVRGEVLDSFSTPSSGGVECTAGVVASGSITARRSSTNATSAAVRTGAAR